MQSVLFNEIFKRNIVELPAQAFTGNTCEVWLMTKYYNFIHIADDLHVFLYLFLLVCWIRNSVNGWLS